MAKKRMGRPPLKDRDKRTIKVEVSMTSDEKKTLDKLSGSLPLARFLRERALGKVVKR